MTLARRLGRGYVTAASAPFEVSGGGLGNQVAWPRAWTHNGKTHYGQALSEKPVWVGEYDHATRRSSAPTVLASITSGDGNVHVNPAILVRDSDKRLIVGYADNVQPSGYSYTFTSTNAEDATAFGAAAKVETTARWAPTYPILVQLRDVASQPIYFITRWYDSGASTFYTGYYKSTDGGSTWSAFQKLWKPVSTNAQYHTVTTDGSTRIDFFVTTTNRAPATPSAVYHAYMVSDTLYQSDGTSIGAASSGPYFATAGTLVQDTSLGSCRSDAAGYSAGKPHAVLVVNDGNTTTDTLVRCARWTGSAWQVNAVTNNGGIISSNWFLAAAAISETSPDVIYTPRKVGSRYEMAKFTSADSGSSWTARYLTLSSPADNLLPFVPRNAAADCEVLWSQGTYTSDFSYNCRLMRYGT